MTQLNQIPYNNKLLIISEFIEKKDIKKILNVLQDIQKRSPEMFPFTAEGRIGSMCMENDDVKSFVKKYGSMSINEFRSNKDFPLDIYFSDYIVAIYTKGGKLDKHSDDSNEYGKQVITTMLYLNDDYEGGEIFFEDLGLLYKPRAGTAIIFPGQYQHEVKPVISGSRYVIGIGTTTEKEKWLNI